MSTSARKPLGYSITIDKPSGCLYFFSASLRPPTAFWTLPSTLSALPSASSLVSPVALPMVSLIEPLISFADPAIRSLFMTAHFYCGHKFRVSRRPYDEGGASAVASETTHIPPPGRYWFCVSLWFFGV